MLKNLLAIFCLCICSRVYAQNLSLHDLQAYKAIFQPDNIQLRDNEIVYPVTGLTEIRMEFMTAGGPGGSGGGLFAVVEMWVIDAKGKIAYNNVYVINPKMLTEGQMVMDPDYMKYMQRNEHACRKRKQSFL